MTCRGLHHTGLVVNDLEKMVLFYTRELGLEVQLELDSVAPPEGNHTGIPGSRRKLVFLGYPGQAHQIELVHYLQPRARDGAVDKLQRGAMHLCFSVEDIQASYDSLRQRGIRFVTEPKWSLSGEGSRIGVVYAQDPEGNWLEFIQWNDARH